jgi:hypothetical protein
MEIDKVHCTSRHCVIENGHCPFKPCEPIGSAGLPVGERPAQDEATKL